MMILIEILSLILIAAFLIFGVLGFIGLLIGISCCGWECYMIEPSTETERNKYYKVYLKRPLEY